MADGSSTPAKKNAPRIAYSGEEYGFGYQATELFATNARISGWVNDGGATGRLEPEFREDARRSALKFDFSATQRLPLRSKEQALLAVKMGTADFAVVPFYAPYIGYDFETLRALSSQHGLLAVEQYEAYDKLCLAVYEPQVLDLVQSAHPGSGLSSLLKKDRRLWNDYSVRPDTRYPSVHDSGEQFRAGLEIDRSAQLMLRDRIDMVFCGPDAARRCKSRLDGLRAAGVEVAETLRSLEPHREMARLARATLNPNRQTNTFYDPRDGNTQFVSTMSAEPQSAKLYGVVLPFQIAMMAQDFTIIDDDIEDSETAKTRFFVVSTSRDKSLSEDALKTTDAKTRYWVNRLREVAQGAKEGDSPWGVTLPIVGAALAAIGAAGLMGWEGLAPLINTSAQTETAVNALAVALGAALIAGGFLLRIIRSAPMHGVRLMLRFDRSSTAASIGDVENYLRNFGVRHQTVRIDEDSEKDRPAPVVLDIEFDPIDFRHNLISMFQRRFRGSVVNGALKKSFQRWKNRGVTVLAAVPMTAEQAQLPKHQRRSWYGDAVKAWVDDFIETQFIRLSRVLFVYILPALIIGALAYWYYIRSGGQ